MRTRKKYYRRRKRKFIKQEPVDGKCKQAKCKEKVAGKTKYCLKHWLSILKNNNHGKKKAAFEVDFYEVWNEQKGKCAITGMDLIPGQTASLDHKTPLSKGGTNSRENLHFVHIAVNCMKQDLTEEEFLELLKILLPKLQGFVDRQK